MTSREKIIGFLQETAEYFRECRSNASFASKAENHFWELQNAANEVAELLKEQEVVMCKDCRYYTEPDSKGDRCDKIHWSRGDDWFCADGKREPD